MKQLKMFLITAILFLFTNSAFSYQPHISSGSVVQIKPPLTIDNYTWVNPGYIQTIDICIPEKISIDGSMHSATPFVYEDYVTWKNNDYTYLWKKGNSAVETTIPKNAQIYDLNDNKILYKYHDKVYLYDVISKTKSLINISTQDAYYPSYDNNELAYLYDDNIYLSSSLTTNKIHTLNYTSFFGYKQSLYNGKIAWADKAENGFFQIFYWNGNTINQITSTNFNNERPSLYNGKIAWKGDKDEHYQIFYWNGDNITQITNTNYDNYGPKLYNGKIVWYGYKDEAHPKAEIFYWNGTDIKQLTNKKNYSNETPDVYNGRIVWIQTNLIDYESEIYTCIAETPLKPSILFSYITKKTSTNVKLNGSINPNKESTIYRFEYGTTSSYTLHTTWTSVGKGTSSIAVNKTIGNLTPNTTYHYRLVAKNTNGQTNGSDHSFKTLAPTPVLPDVTTDNITSTDPYTLSATINPNGFDTTFYFEYGTDTNYGDNTSVSGAGSGETNVTVTTPLSDLQANTTYHYRVVAQNAAGTIEGADKTFTTPTDIIPKINVPAGQHSYTYLPVENPILNINSSTAKPFAVGNIFADTLSLKIGLKPFENPVDIYLAISYSGLPGDIFLIDSSNGLHKNTIVSWKTNQTDAINESLFGDINTTDLPEGTYTLYTLVVPAGATNMSNSYLWITSFSITH